MNNKFSFGRFGQFANAEFRADYKRYMMLILTIGVISTVFYILGGMFWDISIIASVQASFFVAYISSLLNISRSFKKYINPRTNAEAIMLPVAKSEKFTYIYFCNVIAIPLVLYSIVYILALVTGFILDKNIEEIGNMVHIIDMAVLSHIALFSVFFLGSIIFKKYQFIFTCLGVGGIIILLSILAGLTKNWEIWSRFSEMNESCRISNNWDEMISVISNIFRILALVTIFISVLLAWKKYNKIQTA